MPAEYNTAVISTQLRADKVTKIAFISNVQSFTYNYKPPIIVRLDNDLQIAIFSIANFKIPKPASRLAWCVQPRGRQAATPMFASTNKRFLARRFNSDISPLAKA